MEKLPYILDKPLTVGEYQLYILRPGPSSEIRQWRIQIYKGNEPGIFKEETLPMLDDYRFSVSERDQNTLVEGLELIKARLEAETHGERLVDTGRQQDIGMAAVVLTVEIPEDLDPQLTAHDRVLAA